MKLRTVSLALFSVGLFFLLSFSSVNAEQPPEFFCVYVKVNGVDNGSSVCMENSITEKEGEFVRTLWFHTQHEFENDTLRRSFNSQILMRFTRTNNTEAGNRTQILLRQGRGWAESSPEKYYNDVFDTTLIGLMFFQDADQDGFLNRYYYDGSNKSTDIVYLGGIMNFTDLIFEIIPQERLGQKFEYIVTYVNPVIAISSLDPPYNAVDVVTTTNISIRFMNGYDNSTLKTTMVQKISMGPLTNSTALQRFPDGFGGYSLGIYYSMFTPGNSTYTVAVQNKTYSPASHQIELKEKNSDAASFVAKLGGNYTIGNDKSTSYVQNVTIFPRYSFLPTDNEGVLFYMLGFAKWNASLSFEMDPMFEVMGAPFPLEQSPEKPSQIDGASILMVLCISVAIVPLMITKIKKKYNLTY